MRNIDRTCACVYLLQSSIGDGGIKPSTFKTKSKIITVHEGTDLAIAVSPDHKTIVMDLQGIFTRLPMTGGSAKTVDHAVPGSLAHPNWSPRGNLIAIQSYIGGTFHISISSLTALASNSLPMAMEMIVSRASRQTGRPLPFPPIGLSRAAMTSGPWMWLPAH